MAQGEEFALLPSKTSVKQKSRTVSYHHKVRTGCVRCKARRIKCDESKPSCHRCLKAGYTCSGYDVPQTRLFGLDNNDCFNSDLDKHIFHSFCSNGAASLARFQYSSTEFWTSLAPQLSELFPAVRHGLIAISYLQEPVRREQMKNALAATHSNSLRLCLTHYNQSIRSFLSPTSGLTVEARLTCCILYTALSIFMDKVGYSKTHARSGQQILLDRLKSEVTPLQSGDDVLNSVFLPIFQRLIIDTCTFDDSFLHENSVHEDPYTQYANRLLLIPSSFDHIEEALESMSIIVKYVLALHWGEVTSPIFLASMVQKAVKDFNRAMQGVTQLSCPENKDTISYGETTKRLLSMYYHFVTILMQWFVRGHEVCLDLMETDFRTLLLSCDDYFLAEKVLMGSKRHPWTATLPVIPPLFFIATKCRVRSIRHSALQKLHNCFRVERFWSSCKAFSIARFVIEKEEPLRLSTAEDVVPSSSRIQLDNIEILRGQGSLKITYLQSVPSKSRQSYTSIIPCQLDPVLEYQTAEIPVSRKVLYGFGFDGIHLTVPSSLCTCTRSETRKSI